jgi:uncharacterized protein HemX
MEKAFIGVAIGVLLFALGFGAGYAVYVRQYHGQLVEYQDQRIEDQSRIAELERNHRILESRQREAVNIIGRTAGNLDAASRSVESIDDLVDAILRTIGDLESAYRIYGTVE